MTDIDIDLADPTQALDGLNYVFAVQTEERRRHQSGVYFQNIPVDPIDGMAVWDHNVAEDMGYFKIDLLHNSIYHGVRDPAHLDTLLATEPCWDTFQHFEIVRHLAHFGSERNFAVLQQIRPHSILDLAICLALIRPGKKHLIGRPRHEIDAEIWLPTPGYSFKKSHAIAYAASIVVQLNLLFEQHG